MLPAMFGMGGTEIVVILIVALLFLGPDKLPQAAKSISKGIRDIKKQSRALQNQIESDEQIGGAIRDLKSALRGEDAPIRPKPFTPRAQPQPQLGDGAAAVAAAGTTAAIGAGAGAGEVDGGAGSGGDPAAGSIGGGTTAGAATAGAASTEAAPSTAAGAAPAAATASTPGPGLTLPRTAGEPDPIDGPASDGDDDLASLIKPAPGTVAKGS
jgi:sec-independent protein translocase protein TatB